MNFNGTATLTHINARRGSGDDAAPVIDLSLAVTVELGSIAERFGCEDYDALTQAFWDEDGEPRMLNLKGIHLAGKITEPHLFEVGKHHQEVTTPIAKLVAVPAPGRAFYLGFRASIESPRVGFTELMLERLHEEIPLRLAPVNTSML